MGYEKIMFTDQIDESYSVDPEINLYNEYSHLALLDQKIRTFYVVDQPARKAMGLIHFSVSGEEAVSLPRRPFGSFELSHKLNIAILSAFIDYIENELRRNGVRSIIIKGFSPVYHADNFTKVVFSLNQKGFAVSLVDVNYHLNTPEGGIFDQLNPRYTRRRLRLCRDEGFAFRWEDASRLPEIYEFICRSREEKGYPVSIGLDQLRRSLSGFPDSYRLCSVRREGEITATGILVRVNSRIAYDFMHASLAEYNTFSPTLLIVKGMFDFCVAGGYEILDLGVASLDNQLQSGIARFKENIGGIPTVKLTFKKELITKNALT